MKTVLLPFFILITLSVFAQDIPAAQVPPAVVAALTSSHPKATEVRWEKKKELFKADFKIGKADHDVWFDKTGQVTKHRSDIKKEELPAPVTAAITKNFGSYKIDDCEKTDEKGTVTYKVELKSDAGKKNVHFSSDGKVIEKKKED